MKEKKRAEYYVYRYIWLENREIVYVGKTDASLKQRIDAHEKEEKFQPYRGAWKIEYVELSNRVETDIVEKYLINLWKPVLNEKDCVPGLASICMQIPQWKPYSEYEAMKKKENQLLLAIAQKNAKEDTELLFQMVAQNKDRIFSCTLHRTGMLPFPDGLHKVVKTNVFLNGNAYTQQIVPEEKENILRFWNQILVLIWEPVTLLWKFSPKEEEEYRNLCNAALFGQILSDFAKDGFEIEDGLGRGVFEWDANKWNTSYLNQYYGNFFEEALAEASGFLSVKEEMFKFLPRIQEDIACEKIKILRRSGAIPYEDDEEIFKTA